MQANTTICTTASGMGFGQNISKYDVPKDKLYDTDGNPAEKKSLLPT